MSTPPPPPSTPRMKKLVHEMPIWKAALASFLAMTITDCLATGMIIFESRFNAPAAGLLDVLGYIAGLICSVLALDSILKDGWRTKRSLIIIGAITVANYVGTSIGVMVVSAMTHH